MQKAFFSFVVPIYNDAYLAPAMCKAFDSIMKEYFKVESLASTLELIFIDDGSQNDSPKTLIQLAQQYSYIEIIEFSRNFGQHNALSCGYHVCRGDYLTFMDVDMEDPMDQVPLLLDRIRQNDVDMVCGIRQNRKGSLISKLGSKIVKSFLKWATQMDFPTNHATIRCFNRRFIDNFKQYSEKCRYVPGMEFWLGFKRAYVKTIHKARADGKSSYNFNKKFLLALEAVLSFTDFPIKFIMLVGSSVALGGFILAIAIIFRKLFFHSILLGYTSIIATLLFGFGSLIFFVGLTGLYVGKILLEVKGRPLYIIRQRYNSILIDEQSEKILAKETNLG